MKCIFCNKNIKPYHVMDDAYYCRNHKILVEYFYDLELNTIESVIFTLNTDLFISFIFPHKHNIILETMVFSCNLDKEILNIPYILDLHPDQPNLLNKIKTYIAMS